MTTMTADAERDGRRAVTDSARPFETLPDGIDLKRLAERSVLPLRHPGRWIATALVLVLLLNFAQTLFTNPAWEWDKVAKWLFSPAIMTGLQLTLVATAISAVVSFGGGIVIALMRLSGNPVLSTVSWLYIWLFRSVPLILVLIFLYNLGNLYPTVGVGIPFGPQLQVPTVTVLSDLTLGVIGLSLSEIAYSGEIVRAGVAVCRPGTARGGEGARYSAEPPVPAHRSSAGPSFDRAGLREPDHRLAEGLIPPLLCFASRPVRSGAEPRKHVPDRHHPAAGRRHDLVPDPHEHRVDHPVLRRALLRPRRGARTAADPHPARPQMARARVFGGAR